MSLENGGKLEKKPPPIHMNMMPNQCLNVLHSMYCVETLLVSYIFEGMKSFYRKLIHSTNTIAVLFLI